MDDERQFMSVLYYPPGCERSLRIAKKLTKIVSTDDIPEWVWGRVAWLNRINPAWRLVQIHREIYLAA